MMESSLALTGAAGDAGTTGSFPCGPQAGIDQDPTEAALSYMPFVKTIAARVYDTLPPEAEVDLEDLVQAGTVGLLAAVRAYDRASNVAFALYARYRVRGEIFDTLRRLDFASRKWRRLQKQTYEARRELASQLNREPTAEEVGAQLQKEGTAAAADQMLDMLFVQAYSSEDSPAMELRADPGTHPDSLFFRQEARRMLKRALDSLPARLQTVIFLYYSQELTLKQIGENLGVNESRVCQMHRSALEAIAIALRSWGIHGSAA